MTEQKSLLQRVGTETKERAKETSSQIGKGLDKFAMAMLAEVIYAIRYVRDYVRYYVRIAQQKNLPEAPKDPKAPSTPPKQKDSL